MSTKIAHQIIHIISGKGGVGKTTITAGLGALLSLRGMKVLMIDADFGLRNLDLLFQVQERLVFDLGQVLEQKVALQQALIPVPQLDELYLLTSSLQKNFSDLNNPQVDQVLNECRHYFDVILIDHGAGFSHDMMQFIQHGDAAVLVSQPGGASLRSVNKILGVLQSELPCYWIINRWSKAARHNRNLLEEISQIDFPVSATLGDLAGLETMRFDAHHLHQAPTHILLEGLRPLTQQWFGDLKNQKIEIQELLSFESRGLFPLMRRGKMRAGD